MKTVRNGILIFCIIALVVASAAVAPVHAENAGLAGFEKVAGNSNFEMYADMSSGRFAVINKSSGFIWWSNPPGADEDKLAKGIKKMRMLSQLLLTYVDDASKFTSINSNVACIGEKGLKVEKTENGIKAYYTFPREKLTIPVAVTLKEDYFQIEVVTAEIKEEDINKIVTLELYPYLGAGSKGDTGYLVVPDGSGALINFNNGKTQADPYIQDIYGKNEALTRDFEYVTDQTVRLPVFGVKNGDNALLGVVTKGAAAGYINAGISGRDTSYNNVYCGFRYREVDNVVLNSGKWQARNVKVVENKPKHKDSFEIRYYMLDGKDSDYTGMALRYQKYLIDEQGMKKYAGSKDIPFYMDIYGGVKKQKSILGIPLNILTPLTTYTECEEMVSELRQSNIGNIVLRYQGWTQGGIFSKLPSKIRPESKLGGNSGFKKLVSFLDGNNVEFYPNIDLLDFYRSGNLYFIMFDSAKTISGSPAKQYYYRIDTQSKLTKVIWYLLSPGKVFDVAGKSFKSLSSYKVSGVSLQAIGNVVYSDFGKENITQTQTENIWKDVMKAGNDKIGNVMVDGGNAYTLPYAKHVVNAPLYSSKFDIEDEEIPFYHIVLHGYVSYAAPPLNLSSVPSKQMLRCIETGSNLQFSWIYRDSSLVKDTWFDYIYGADYKRWKDDAVTQYGELNRVLSGVASQRIVGHKKLMEDVYETDYENGTRIIVNYADKAVSFGGTSVKAQGYAVIGGE